jgi:hypothetical protein
MKGNFLVLLMGIGSICDKVLSDEDQLSLLMRGSHGVEYCFFRCGNY